MTVQLTTPSTTTGPILPLSFAGIEQVTDAQLKRYADLIYDKTGIRVSPQKKALLSNRLRRRLRSTGIRNFEEYYRHLTTLTTKDPEWDAFIQEITTHETYLFRDENQWRWFREEYLPSMAADSPTTARPCLRIWSAACSTGDEPYTIACCVAAARAKLGNWQVRILGTDIGVGALERARQGEFSERAMRLVPESLRRQFFTSVRETSAWRARPELGAMLSFRAHNLLDQLHEKPFDLVILKNVLIYFNGQSKAAVLQHVRQAIRPGGLLMTGTAEGVADLLRDYERLKPWLFRKPAPKRGTP